MAWQTEITTIVRYLINDFESPQTYTDAKLQTAVVIASHLMLEDISFPRVYNIDIGATGISPDPTSDTRDNAFINLAALKAACLVDNWAFRSKLPTAGIAIRTGPESIDTRGVLAAYQFLQQNGACKAFEQAKWEYESGNMTPGRAILAPFVGDNVNTDFNTYPGNKHTPFSN
jgi:hypothetical protein